MIQCTSQFLVNPQIHSTLIQTALQDAETRPEIYSSAETVHHQTAIELSGIQQEEVERKVETEELLIATTSLGFPAKRQLLETLKKMIAEAHAQLIKLLNSAYLQNLKKKGNLQPFLWG